MHILELVLSSHPVVVCHHYLRDGQLASSLEEELSVLQCWELASNACPEDEIFPD